MNPGLIRRLRVLSCALVLLVVSGSPGQSCSTTAVRTITVSGTAGGSVSGAGDFDADGWPDIVTGAPAGAGVPSLGNCNPTSYGYIQVFSSNPALANAPSQGLILTLYSPEIASSCEFGFSVCGLGDLDGDGHPEIAVGSPKASPPGLGLNRAGSVFVYRGGPGATHPLLYRWDGLVAEEHLGFSLAAIGDLNGDGVTEVLVGSSYGNVSDSGKATLFSGGTGQILWRYEAGYYFYGFSVAGCGDVNGDGTRDFAVGYKDSYVYVHSGGGSIPVGGIIRVITGNVEGFGHALAGAGDINGDGLGDIAVGSPWLSTIFTGTGYVRFYSPSTGAQIRADGLTGSFGTEVAGIGDFNGDGIPDTAVGGGSPASGGGGYNPRVYSGADCALLCTLSAFGSPNSLQGIAAIGDADLDGDPDVVTSVKGIGAFTPYIRVFGGLPGQPPTYPGTPQGSLALTSAVNAGSLVPLPHIRSAAGGNIVTIHVGPRPATPPASSVGLPLVLVAEAFPTVPAPHVGLMPGLIHVGLGFVILLNGLDPALPGFLGVVGPFGNHFPLLVPPGLGGTSVIFQAAVVGGSGAVFTEAHEFQLQ